MYYCVDGSLKRLRNHLATEGCAESQVVLAKQLLGGTSDDSGDSQIEDEQMGVYWLVRASEQGSQEAVDLLQDCLTTGRGITHHNLVDVRRCVDMNRQEQLARQAATNLFHRYVQFLLIFTKAENIFFYLSCFAM